MRISNAERQIMEALWRGKPLRPEEIITAVGPSNSWADSTVRTLVHRLLRKKAIVGNKEKVGYLYRALISREEFLREESRGFLDRLFDDQLAPLVLHLVKHRALTPTDIQMLKNLKDD